MSYSFSSAIRADHPEKMDEPGVSVVDLNTAHSELRTINRYLGGYKVLSDGLRKVQKFYDVRSVIDVGCGSGDNLRHLAAFCRNLGTQVSFTGIDINPDAIQLGTIHSADYPEISFKSANAFDDFGKADVITCSLFCHHFPQKKLSSLLSHLVKSANHAVIINDLDRHWFAYQSISLLTKFFSKSLLVKYDAPLSVARAFTREDWEDLIELNRIEDYDLKWMWAWRWQFIIYK